MTDKKRNEEESLKQVEEFNEWANSHTAEEYLHHYTVGDTVGLSLVHEFDALVGRLFAKGIDPISATRQGAVSVAAFAFQLGYDYHAETGAELTPCQCGGEEAKTIEDELKKLDEEAKGNEGTPGMYL